MCSSAILDKVGRLYGHQKVALRTCCIMEPGRRGSLGLTSLSLKVPSLGGGGGGALTKQLSMSSTGLNVVRPDDLRRATLSKLALASSAGSSPKQGHRLLAPGYMHQRRNSDFLLKVSTMHKLGVFFNFGIILKMVKGISP